MYNYGYGTQSLPTIANNDLWTIISFLVAICGGIVLYFTFLNPQNAKNYTGTTKKIYNFLSFQTFSLEVILKLCYLIVAVFISIMSFSYISTSFIAFLLCLIGGNILVRLVFEGALLIVMIYRKLTEINEKMDHSHKKEDKKNFKIVEKNEQ